MTNDGFIFYDIIHSQERYLVYFLGYDVNLGSGQDGTDGNVTVEETREDLFCWITGCTQAMGMLFGR